MNINRALLSLILSSAIFVTSDNAFAKSKKAPRQIVKGVISQLTTTLVTVKEKAITLTTRTRYEDFNDNSVNLGAFRVGDCVKIQVTLSGSLLIAREMELEDSCRSRTVSSSSKNKSDRFDDSQDDDSNDDNSRSDNDNDSDNDRYDDDSRREGSKSGKGRGKRDDK